LTLQEIEAAVQNIVDLSWDPEVAHSREDDLYESVLRFIASGQSDAAPLAAAVLKTKDIEFTRWCA